MKKFYVYTDDEVNDPIDLLDAIDAGLYAGNAERARELATELERDTSRGTVRVYELSCEEI